MMNDSNGLRFRATFARFAITAISRLAFVAEAEKRPRVSTRTSVARAITRDAYAGKQILPEVEIVRRGS